MINPVARIYKNKTILLIVLSSLCICFSGILHLSYTGYTRDGPYRWQTSTPGTRRLSTEKFDNLYQLEQKEAYDERRLPYIIHLVDSGVKEPIEKAVRDLFLQYSKGVKASSELPDFWFGPTNFTGYYASKSCGMESVMRTIKYDYLIILTIRSHHESQEVKKILTGLHPVVQDLIIGGIEQGRVALDVIHNDRKLFEALIENDVKWKEVVRFLFYFWDYIDGSTLSDVYRLIVLHYHGGIYTDTDRVWHRSFKEYQNFADGADANTSPGDIIAPGDIMKFTLLNPEWSDCFAYMRYLEHGDGGRHQGLFPQRRLNLCKAIDYLKEGGNGLHNVNGTNSDFIGSFPARNKLADIENRGEVKCSPVRHTGDPAYTSLTTSFAEYVSLLMAYIDSGQSNFDIKNAGPKTHYRMLGPMYYQWILKPLNTSYMMLNDHSLSYIPYSVKDMMLKPVPDWAIDDYTKRFGVHLSRQPRLFLTKEAKTIQELPEDSWIKNVFISDCPTIFSNFGGPF